MYLYLWTGEERFREYLRSGRGQQRRGEVLRLFKIWQGPAENYLYLWTGVDEYDFTIRYMSLIRVNCCNKVIGFESIHATADLLGTSCVSSL